MSKLEDNGSKNEALSSDQNDDHWHFEKDVDEGSSPSDLECLLIGAIALLLILMASNAGAQTYNDKFERWNPLEKEFDVVCFEEGVAKYGLKGYTLKALKKSNVTFEKDSKTYSFNASSCLLEQKTELPVAREEVLQALYRAKCDFYSGYFQKFDFRILAKNESFFHIKRITDGKVWSLPVSLCSVTQVLGEFKPKIVAKAQATKEPKPDLLKEDLVPSKPIKNELIIREEVQP